MSDEVSFEENLPTSNSNSNITHHAPVGHIGTGFGGGYNEGPKKGLTQWIAEKLGASELAANIVQIIFALAIFVLAGYIFWSALAN